MDCIESVPGGVRVTVWLVPNANRSEVTGLHDGALRIRVAAPASEGRANAALRTILERMTGGKASIVQGRGSRRKVVSIAGVDDDHVRRVLDASGARGL